MLIGDESVLLLLPVLSEARYGSRQCPLAELLDLNIRDLQHLCLVAR